MTKLFPLHLLLLILAGTSGLRAGEDAIPVTPDPGIVLPWQTNFAEALARAQRENKPLVVNFTGSDWCVWCHRLRDEVFLTKPFAAFAETGAVLVELDFPRKKELPPELKKQNDALAEKYEVTAYPTILVLSPAGESKGRLGYMQGGPKTFIRELRRMAAGSPKS